MKVINTKEKDNEKRYVKLFDFDNTIQIDSLIELIKQFENEQVKMLECHCHTYAAEGNRLYYGLTSIEEIKSVYEKAVSPYFDFSIDFGDRQTFSYAFSLVTSINSNSLIYEVDKKKITSNFGRTNTSGRR